MNEETHTEPEKLSNKTIVHWSNTYKKLEVIQEQGIRKTTAIRTKARKFLENSCIEEKANGLWICKHIEGYNKTDYEITFAEKGGFECNCQFHQTVVKQGQIPNLVCSHVCALKMFLKIKSWNKPKKKDAN